MTVAMKQGSQSQHSKLLSNGENQALVALLGAKCQSLCTSVIQLFLTYAPDHTQWRRHDAGVICFVKDHLRRSYFFRLFCLTRRQIVWEQEVYTDMDYVAARPWLHTFEAESSMAAFNFANEDEANSFMVVVLRQLQNKRQRRVEKTNERKRLSMGEISGSTPKLAGSVGALNGPPSHRHHHHRSASSGTTKDKKKDKESLKKKIKKEDIGVPLNFRHVSHVGWDQNKGFDVDLEQIQDPNLKKFFEKAGVSETQLQDRTTREFIYDFIEKNGGLEAVKDDVVIVGRPTKAPPVPSRAPPLPSQHKMAPPPPSVTRACPPTPVTQRNAPPPPPPPSGKPSNQSTAAPPPPPPPPEMSPVPPPPPPAAPVTAAAPSFPAPADPRAELMAAIKSGRTLKHVEVEKKPTPDSRGELLSQIRQGVELKSVPQTELQKQAPSEPADGLAGALARALAERSRAFHDSDSESDSGSGDSDSEWEE